MLLTNLTRGFPDTEEPGVVCAALQPHALPRPEDAPRGRGRGDGELGQGPRHQEHQQHAELQHPHRERL